MIGFRGQRSVGVALLATLLATCGDSAAGPLIVIDGAFGDWDAVPPALVDSLENGPGAVDFGEIRVESDDSAVYFAIDLGRTINPQAMQGTVRLVLDTDGDPTTGGTSDGLDGVDRTISMSPGPTDGGAVGHGMLTATAGDDSAAADVYGLGLEFAPTWADRYTEVRIARGGAAGFTGETFRARLVYEDAAGRTADETAMFEAPLRARSGRGAVPGSARSLERSPGTAFRLLAWNVSDNGPVEASDEFMRTIASLEPDVILFDEVSPAIDSTWFAARLERIGPGWTILRGRAGGRQTALVASRLPLRPIPSLERIEYPDSIFALLGQPSTPQLQADLSTGRTDGMPALGGMLEIDDRRILLLTLDLQCCGHAGSTEDRARIIMAMRLRDAVAEVVREQRPDGVIIAGDFNLVGAHEPLDAIARGLDPAGGDLVPATTLRLNGVSMATWRARGPFPPGRLDWVLYSPGALRALNAFPFDAADLRTDAAASLGLQPTDAAGVSDHRPVIVDFAPRR